MKVGAFVIDVALEVPPGITVLFGPSGSGKSTTLAAIAGLLRPEVGRVALGDTAWFDAELGIDSPPELRSVSLVFQSLALFPHLTALENVEYGIDRRMPRAERVRRAREMLDRMKVPHVAARKPATFSGGEAQRVALARGFARKPRLVLLDEAFSALDRELRYELGADVRSMISELDVPAIVVTHHRMEARSLGDRAILLRNGLVEKTGPARQVIPAPEREE